MPSYEKRGDSWSVRIEEYQDGVRIRKRLSGFKTKKQAQEAAVSYMESQKTKSSEPALRYRFDAIFEAYLEDLKAHAKESSIYTFRGKGEIHLLPTFGNLYMDEITPLMVNAWLANLEVKNSYKQGLRNLFAQTLKFGSRIYGTPNIMPKVTPLRDNSIPTEMQIWSPEEFQKVADQLDGVPKLFFRLLFISGCRKNEALALQWTDIRGNSISISKTITRKSDDAPWKLTAPKTKGSYRIVPMPAPFMHELQQLHTHEGFVFSRRDGEAPMAETTFDHAFKDAIKKAGVKPIRIHDLRHSCVSYLISIGIPITAIAKRIGHDNIEQTLNTYSHMLPQQEDQMVSAFRDI